VVGLARVSSTGVFHVRQAPVESRLAPVAVDAVFAQAHAWRPRGWRLTPDEGDGLSAEIGSSWQSEDPVEAAFDAWTSPRPKE
jgi:hypothetical protein